MRLSKLLIYAFTLLLIFLAGRLIYLKVTAPTRVATVKLKEALIDEPQPDGKVISKDSISGEVTTTEKYVTVKNEKREFVLTWDQVKTISEDKQSKTFEGWVELIEFLSKLGVIAAVFVFSVGLYQYYEGQRWKKEEFLASAFDEFMGSSKAGNARLMLDSLYLHKKSTTIRLYPNKEVTQQMETVYNYEVYAALDIDRDREFNAKALEIRDCFDAYFGYLEEFNHYITNGLVAKESVYTYLKYQLTMLGSEKLRYHYRSRLLTYATHFEFEGAKDLVKRYESRLRKWKDTKAD